MTGKSSLESVTICEWPLTLTKGTVNGLRLKLVMHLICLAENIVQRSPQVTRLLWLGYRGSDSPQILIPYLSGPRPLLNCGPTDLKSGLIRGQNEQPPLQPRSLFQIAHLRDLLSFALRLDPAV
ncbi:hypothetical protein VTO42DRAFT_6361 [Malbranchea cinnamomea]